MKVRRLKVVLETVAAVTAVAVVVAVLGGLAGGIAFFGSGADPATALNETAVLFDESVDVTWQPDAPDSPRAMEDATRSAVTASYLAAWNHRTAGGDGDYLAGPAAAAIPATGDDRVTEVDVAHDLRLDFYSADGQLVAFTDDAVVARRAQLDGGHLWNQLSDERYTVVMILVDGNWRLRHWVRRATSS